MRYEPSLEGRLSAQSGNLMLAVRLTGHDPERSLARPNSRTAAKPLTRSSPIRYAATEPGQTLFGDKCMNRTELGDRACMLRHFNFSTGGGINLKWPAKIATLLSATEVVPLSETAG
jgi:hypothetical protein